MKRFHHNLILDKKLLNTLKVVIYDQEKQRITSIRGLEIKRNQENILKWGFSTKKQRSDITRKKRRDEIPSISTEPSETTNNQTDTQTKIESSSSD